MVLTWDITIPELTKEETRKAYLYLPDSYEAEPGRRYPVLYLFDGHNVFFDSHATYGKSWGMKESMDYSQMQMILVAVECNHSPDNGRLREYSPYTFYAPSFGKITGLGKTYMEWLIHTFKPQIDEHYRTLPERENTFIAGSSMGGLMSLYAVLEYNNIFSKAAALSPSIWVANGRIQHLAQQAELDPDTVIYMDYGSREFENHANMQRLFAKLTGQLINRNISVTSRVIPGGTHCEASWEKQIPFFMETLLYRPME
jgi:predicted alpha/beta superfamily hydrolase